VIGQAASNGDDKAARNVRGNQDGISGNVTERPIPDVDGERVVGLPDRFPEALRCIFPMRTESKSRMCKFGFQSRHRLRATESTKDL
jgi:hypothetical protein